MHREQIEREARNKIMLESIHQGNVSAGDIRRKLRDTQKQQSEGRI